MEDSKFIISALDEAAQTVITLQAIALQTENPWSSDNVILLLDKLRVAKLLLEENCNK